MSSRISHKNLLKNRSTYARIYEDMAGVDLTETASEDSMTSRYAYTCNMYRDYESGSGNVIESIPGYRTVLYLGARINGIHFQSLPTGEEYAVIHSGEHLYRFPVADMDFASEYVGEGTLSFDDCKTRSASIGGTLYIADGSSITRVTPNGGVARVLDSSSAAPYVPITYLNGQVYEQRNLLTDKFIEKFTLADWQSFSYGTEGLIFSVTDEAEGLCSVIGYEGHALNDLYIPAYTTIGNRKYRVTKIAPHAFSSNTDVRSVRFADGILEVGNDAFYGCTQLAAAYLSPSLEKLGFRAFGECTSLQTVHIGKSIKQLSSHVFISSGVTEIYFGGTSEEFYDAEIMLDDTISVCCEIPYNEGCLEFPVNTPSASIQGLFMNGVEQNVLTAKTNREGVITSIILYLKSAPLANGAEIEIRGKASKLYNTPDPRGADFMTTQYVKTYGAKAAVINCKYILAYDGKLFMSGNPDLPGVVFYSSKSRYGIEEPLYFGSLCFFSDGGSAVLGLSSLSGELAVLTENGIYCHTPTDDDALKDTRYPVTTVSSGVRIYGEPISFGGETVFLSDNGICSIGKANSQGERKIECRSTFINPHLLDEDPKGITLSLWRGYLAVCSKGKIYLGDSRRVSRDQGGGREYEWFYLADIGSRKGHRRVYRYAPVADEGFYVSELADKITDREVMSTVTEAGSVIYYVIEDGKKVQVYPTAQLTGGEFHPAELAASLGDLLFFGTDDGGLFVFNNDKRGVPPSRISADPDFDPEEYKRVMGRRIHPEYYSFDGHAPIYALSTFDDDCGIPYLRKSTRPGLLTIKCKSFDTSAFSVEVVTDRTGCNHLGTLPSGKQCFTDLDFSTFTASTDDYFTVSVPENQKRWVTKRIRIFSNEYCAPFGIYGISYSFTPEGKI